MRGVLIFLAQPISVELGQGHLRTHRSEEHTSELQSQSNVVCRLLLEKKATTPIYQGVFRRPWWQAPPLSAFSLLRPRLYKTADSRVDRRPVRSDLSHALARCGRQHFAV